MCLILFALQDHPKYKLIVASNRDEFYARPTQKTHFWKGEGYPNLLAGKDQKAGGTWLGMTKTGRFAALTNYRDIYNIRPDAPTRGNLVSDFLKGDMTALAYLQKLEPTAKKYNGFSLLLGTVDELYYFSNYGKGIEKVAQGVHGLCNALLNTPWHKVETGKTALAKSIKNQENLTFEGLAKILQNPSTTPDSLLPQTGLEYKLEKAVSAIFIQTPEYGTCSSGILLVDKNNKATYQEFVYNTANGKVEKQLFEMQLEMI